MPLLKKKPDPITDKARALNNQIAALEAEIKRLDSQLARVPEPKLRSTATPRGGTTSHVPEKPVPPPPATKPTEPVFEEVNRAKLASRDEAPEMFNDLGVRKYDLPALWNRIRNHLRGPTTSNPKLVNYLVVGSVHGLRPLRYEKRVARNRFTWLVIVVALVLFGLFYMILGRH